MTQRGPSSPSGWRQQVHPHWGAHSTVVAPSHMVQSWLGLRPPSLLWELPNILLTNAFSAQALICNQDHMDQCRKILTTSGFQKCKRRTKIKHQKQLNQRSDGSENETSKDSHCKVALHTSASSSFSHPDLYASALVSANTCFLCVPNPEEGTTTKKQTEFLCALLFSNFSLILRNQKTTDYDAF